MSFFHVTELNRQRAEPRVSRFRRVVLPEAARAARAVLRHEAAPRAATQSHLVPDTGTLTQSHLVPDCHLVPGRSDSPGHSRARAQAAAFSADSPARRPASGASARRTSARAGALSLRQGPGGAAPAPASHHALQAANRASDEHARSHGNSSNIQIIKSRWSSSVTMMDSFTINIEIGSGSPDDDEQPAAYTATRNFGTITLGFA